MYTSSVIFVQNQDFWLFHSFFVPSFLYFCHVVNSQLSEVLYLIILCECFFPLGHAILSGCSSGVVAISNPSTGLVVRVITDHQGAPICDMHVASKPIKVHVLRI